MKVSKYHVVIECLNSLLGSCPADPSIYSMHLQNKHNKLIDQIKKKASKEKTTLTYNGAEPIPQEKFDRELELLIGSLERSLRRSFTDDEKALLIAGDKSFVQSIFNKETQDFGNATVFLKDENDHPVISSHMILGFLKSAGIVVCRATPKAGKRKALDENGEELGSGTMYSSQATTTMLLNQHVKILPELLRASRDIERDDSGMPKLYERPLQAKTPLGPRSCLAASEVLPKGTQFEFDIWILGGDNVITQKHLEEAFSIMPFKGLGAWRCSGNHGGFEVKSITRTE